MRKNEEIDQSEMLIEMVSAVYTIDELDEMQDEHNFEITDIMSFGGALAAKVFNQKDKNEDGQEILKEIESQKDLKPVKYSKKKTIRSQYNKYVKVMSEAQKVASHIQVLLGNKNIDGVALEVQSEKQKTLEEKMEVEDKSLQNLINDAHDLDTSSMSDWEKDLLKSKIIQNSFGNYTPVVGKK